MEVSGTALLRKAAPSWNLAGDKHLLGVLEKMHQNIMSKCLEVNNRLDEMVTTLDNANIDLQNVNNKFMALSNTQFVESRVYDDDVDVLEEATDKNEPPKSVEPESELVMLKRGLQVLEDYHETVRILDSDSSDEEDDGRLVLKPKELYSARPLPYIIGSHNWKTKWHVGLVVEDSDTDSSVSKHDPPSEEYSDSEPEVSRTTNIDEHVEQRTVSSGSDLWSEPSARPAGARGAAGPEIEEPEPIVPEPTQRKLYKVDQPVTSTIFPDEPPPLDQSESYEYSDEDDIFAELHKNPYPHSNKNHDRMNFAASTNVVDDLFGDSENDFYGHSNRGENTKKPNNGGEKTNNSGKGKYPLFDDELEPQSSTQAEVPNPKETSEAEASTKKPIGGISLFGSNKGTESIGAAILRRNQRKSSSNEENDEIVEPTRNTPVAKVLKETDAKDVIKDLFVRSNANKRETTNVAVKGKHQNITNKEAEKSKTTIDLFSDDIFDDVDDIFADIVTKSDETKKVKSLFDDDAHDLFAEVAVTTQSIIKKPSKSIFDSDDDLFSENQTTKNSIKDKVKEPSKENIKVTKKPISMFSDESDDELFTKENLGDISAVIPKLVISNNGKVKNNTSQSEIITEPIVGEKLNADTEVKTLFNDVSDDEIFTEIKPDTNLVNNQKISQVTDSTKENNTIEEVFIGIAQDDSNKSKDDKDTIVRAEIINVSNVQQSLNETQANKIKINKEKNNEVDSILNDKDEWEDDIFLSGKNSNRISETTKNDIISKKDIFEVAKNVKEINITLEQGSEKKSNDLIPSTSNIKININVNKPDTVFQSPSLFDEDDINNYEETGSYVTNIKQKNSEEFSSIIDNNINIIHDTVKTSLSPNRTIIADNKGVQQPKKSDDEDKTVNNIGTDDFLDPRKSSSQQDGYDELFNDLPPEFEKPIETKKSKNVNALFDDDSDDEASFFRKNDVISDEKPELVYSDNRFTIFHDEPPDIDVDFSQKARNTTLDKQDYSDDDLFTIKSKTHKDKSKTTEQALETSITSQQHYVQEDIFKETDNQQVKNKPVDISQLLNNDDIFTGSHNRNTLNNSLITTKIKKDFEETSNVDFNSDFIDTPEIDTKKIGKLKPTNLSINVNTLLPGAVVRTKIKEETDGQSLSTKSNEELNIHTPVESEFKIVKSVSFDDNADSGVLDNKVSKERAKIKVKRRPSTRRARLEAVRKSGINFGEDSTDNSSSFDEPPKYIDADEISVHDRSQIVLPNNNSQLKSESKQVMTKNSVPINEAILPTNTNPDMLVTKPPSSDTHINKESKLSHIKEFSNNDEIFKNNQARSSNKSVPNSVGTIEVNIRKHVNQEPSNKNTDTVKSIAAGNISDIKSTVKDVKSKVVYILNDEDIFTNTNIVDNKISTIGSKRELTIIDSDDELFKGAPKATISNVLKESRPKDTVVEKDMESASVRKAKSIFDDLSDDDEWFTKKVVKSDVKSELFSERDSKSDIKQKSLTKPVKSLFGDESDEELFSVKPTTSIGARSVNKPKDVISLATEAVNQDPLSMFNDSDS